MRGNCASPAEFGARSSSRSSSVSSHAGDPHQGFARIYCDACGHEFLLAYSCKTRYFCPSCHQKRVLLYGEWVEQNVLAPVAHPAVRVHAAATPAADFRAPAGVARRALSYRRAPARRCVRRGSAARPPGAVLFVQTFGDLAYQIQTALR